MPTHDAGCLSVRVLRRQIASLPCGHYEVRLIHAERHTAYPGLRRWNAAQLLDPTTVRFLRLRNGQGYDVYFRPDAGPHHAGYILLDLDHPCPGFLAHLRTQQHAPSVLVQTSPGHCQAWIRVSPQPLPPGLATAIAKRLALLYGADLASTDWRHLGRLAGFTNRKPQRRQPNGLAPWVQLLYAHPCLAHGGTALIDGAVAELTAGAAPPGQLVPPHNMDLIPLTALDTTTLHNCYQDCLLRLRIPQRYPSPDWSIADKWVARQLLQSGMPPATVAAVLRHGSPGFPRRHGDPHDYLSRTIRCAARQIDPSPFPPRTFSHP